MRKAILYFLEQQKPSLIYDQKEGFGVFDWIWRVWLSPEEKILSLMAAYTPISVLCMNDPSETPLLGSADNSFFGKMKRMVVSHETYGDALNGFKPTTALLDTHFLRSCDVFVQNIRSRADCDFTQSIAVCKVLEFACVDAKLGVFSILLKIRESVEHFVLLLGRKNFLQLGNVYDLIDQRMAQEFIDALLGRYFDIEWRVTYGTGEGIHTGILIQQNA